MIWLSSALFTGVFFLWTGLAALLGLPLLALGARACNRYGRWWSGSVIFLLRLICRAHSVFEAREKLPSGASLIAMKHQSTWDTLAAACLLPSPAFVLKQELLRVPFFGWLLKRCDMVPVNRAGGAGALRAMVTAARTRLAEGRSVVIYPEGTRREPGAAPQYHPGIAALYRELAVPVVPIAVNSGHYWGRLSFLKRPGTLRLRVLESIPPGLPPRDFLRLLEQRLESASVELSLIAHRDLGQS